MGRCWITIIGRLITKAHIIQDAHRFNKQIVNCNMMMRLPLLLAVPATVLAWCADDHDPVPPIYHPVSLSASVGHALSQSVSGKLAIALNFSTRELKITLPMVLERAEEGLIADGATLHHYSAAKRVSNSHGGGGDNSGARLSMHPLVDNSFAVYQGKITGDPKSFSYIYISNATDSNGIARFEVTGIVIVPSKGDAFHIMPMPAHDCSQTKQRFARFTSANTNTSGGNNKIGAADHIVYLDSDVTYVGRRTSSAPNNRHGRGSSSVEESVDFILKGQPTHAPATPPKKPVGGDAPHIDLAVHVLPEQQRAERGFSTSTSTEAPFNKPAEGSRNFGKVFVSFYTYPFSFSPAPSLKFFLPPLISLQSYMCQTNMQAGPFSSS